MAVFVTSDLHLGHQRDFIWGPRGFTSSVEADEEVIRRFNSVISAEDDVYLLGDLMLGDNAYGIECLKRLNGKLHVLWGNHDTDARKKLYETLPNVVEICGYATMLKYNKHHFYLSHFPTLTANLDDSGLKHAVLNLSGHTHSREKFFYDLPYVYNVALDAHDCYPVNMDDVLKDMYDKVEECKKFLQEAEAMILNDEVASITSCDGNCNGCAGCH